MTFDKKNLCSTASGAGGINIEQKRSDLRSDLGELASNVQPSSAGAGRRARFSSALLQVMAM